MDTKVNYAAVGIFVIGLGALLLAAILWLAAGGEVHHKIDLYQSLSTESVAGLNLNAPVKYRGVDVGKVRDIRLVPDNPQIVQLVYAIDDGTPVKTDTVATLTTQGLTGIAYIELSGGSPSAPALVPKTSGEVPIIPTKPSLTARLEQVLTRVLASVDRTSQNLNGVFSDENKKALTLALDNVARLSQTLADRRDSIDAMLRNADRTAANAARLSGELDHTIARIDRAADSFDAMSRSVDGTAANANRTVTAVGAATCSAFTNETVPQMENLMNDLSVLSASLRRLSEQTERNPKSLIFEKHAESARGLAIMRAPALAGRALALGGCWPCDARGVAARPCSTAAAALRRISGRSMRRPRHRRRRAHRCRRRPPRPLPAGADRRQAPRGGRLRHRSHRLHPRGASPRALCRQPVGRRAPAHARAVDRGFTRANRCVRCRALHAEPGVRPMGARHRDRPPAARGAVAARALHAACDAGRQALAQGRRRAPEFDAW